MPINANYIKKIVRKFDALGNISENEVALCFEMKEFSRKSKEKDFNGFAFNHSELNEMAETIKSMIDRKVPFEFSVAIKEYGDVDVADGHWVFGSFQYDPDKNDLKIVLCDPLGEKAAFTMLMMLQDEGMDFSQLNPNGTTDLYVSVEKLQNSPKGCSYFAIDGCFMLSNQKEFEDIYDYMETNKAPEDTYVEDKQLIKEMMGNVNLVYATLPVRLIRGQQSISELSKKTADDDLSSKVVNKKGQSFKGSVDTKRKEIIVHSPEGNIIKKARNQRIDQKMSSLQKKVETYLDQLESEKEIDYSSHRLQGFKEYAESLTLSKDMRPGK